MLKNILAISPSPNDETKPTILLRLKLKYSFWYFIFNNFNSQNMKI